MLERIGPVAYILALPTSTRAHIVFHVSLLKKYVYDPNHVINRDVIQVEPKGEFQTEPLHILDRKVHTALKLSCWTGKGAVEALQSR